MIKINDNQKKALKDYALAVVASAVTMGVALLTDMAPHYAVVIGAAAQEGQMMVRVSNDPYTVRYSSLQASEPDGVPVLDDGVWNLQKLLAKKPLVNPTTGEVYPAEAIAPGVMTQGSTDPEAPEYQSRSTWDAAERVIELRLPYQAIGFSDPSSLQALRVDADGSIGTETVGRVGITVVLGGKVFGTNGYAWEPWQKATWHERLKAGFEVFARAVIAANSP